MIRHESSLTNSEYDISELTVESSHSMVVTSKQELQEIHLSMLSIEFHTAGFLIVDYITYGQLLFSRVGEV